MRSSRRATPVTLLKFGGSLITEKTRAMTPRAAIIMSLALQIAKIREARPLLQLVIGNGAGSFGHFQVLQHGLDKGMQKKTQRIGFAEVRDSTAVLNRLVVRSLIDAGVPAIAVSPPVDFGTADPERKGWPEVVAASLKAGLVPVVYGDIVLDSRSGCRIISTEQLFERLLDTLPVTGYVPDRIIHLGRVAGVLDSAGTVIPEITPDTWHSVRSFLTDIEGFDVTGGMKHKIESALEAVSSGVTTIIASGESDNIIEQVLGNGVLSGTVIRS
ncbi:MAG: isopentenyl phosphate kinase [Patescibacteria group bacterium]|nr:isopentenyl phosphate kinase [Patescibacteria group bacterium]